MNHLLDRVTMKAMNELTAQAVNSFSVRHYTDEHRKHLGASVIGHDCARYIWFVFRWARREPFTGQKLRLFNRGNREEAQFIHLLRGSGWQIFDHDPATGNQFRITGSGGHFGGSVDSVGIAPAEFPYRLPMIVEFKTHNAKSFSKLKKDGVMLSKPRHYAQMCAYGKFYGFQFGMYCAVNKDDDELHFEFLQLDFSHADDLAAKADDIIKARTPPQPISLQPEHFECKFCPFPGICFRRQPVEKNCRSCQHSRAADNKQWFCELYQQNIPEDFIPHGCDRHMGVM